MYANPCKICQQFKKRKTIYGSLPSKNIVEIKPWDTVNAGLIGPCSKSIRQHQPDGAIFNNNVSLAYMTMINPTTGWFEISEVPMYGLYEVMGSDDDYIDKSYFRVSQLFNSTCLSR